MDNPNNSVINYCTVCEIEYAGRQGTPCPLCPHRVSHEDAVREIRNAEPCRIVERVSASDMQASINTLAASGWALADLRIAHVRNHGQDLPIYVRGPAASRLRPGAPPVSGGRRDRRPRHRAGQAAGDRGGNRGVHGLPGRQDLGMKLHWNGDRRPANNCNGGTRCRRNT